MAISSTSNPLQNIKPTRKVDNSTTYLDYNAATSGSYSSLGGITSVGGVLTIDTLNNAIRSIRESHNTAWFMPSQELGFDFGYHPDSSSEQRRKSKLAKGYRLLYLSRRNKDKHL